MTIALPQRERNKLRTWEALHETALRLVAEHGLAGVTVHAISDEASVSRRTFFNYFATKEDAVLGARAPQLSADDLAEFAGSEDELGRAARLMAAAITSVFRDIPAFSRRRNLLKQYPELRTRLDQHIRDAERLVESVLTDGDTADDEAAANGRALLMLAGTIVRFAYTPGPDGAIDSSPAALDVAIRRFREVFDRVS